MKVGVPKETYPGETRVAVSPAVVPLLIKMELGVIVESGAGRASGYSDEEYKEAGAEIGSRSDPFGAEIVAQVRAVGAYEDTASADLGSLRSGQVVIGTCNSLAEPEPMTRLAEKGATTFAMELMPRITRAQSMDVLSSQASIAGYKAVLVAAEALPKLFPMMSTAAGTIQPAKVLVMGAGVAGLQAIATARRLGAIVSAYDIRAAVKEQIESLGAKFVELDLPEQDMETAGGYAKEQSEEFLAKQREELGKVIAENDVVITTAQVPGKKAPVLVDAKMVAGMASGSVIVDLAAEQGGNVEGTVAGQNITTANGVLVIGPENLPGTVARDSSQVYAKNVQTFLKELLKEGQLDVDLENQVIADTLVTKDGEVVNNRVREGLGLAPIEPPAPPEPEPAPATEEK
ncbi:MAG: Re/Si-specific NAD(P)(+) transhydrogenase subunit alpha, partial [Actinobacteria bacterium]|nr:Re/Si-specific NAD(P)(+) transhydrogenase subunit alpha [Actinomycetota bacterium]